MKESKMLYIAKRLCRKLDKKNDEAMGMVKYFNERIARDRGEEVTDAHAKNKSFWLGYSKAIDYCQKEMTNFIADIKESEHEDVTEKRCI